MIDPATFHCQRCGACCRVPGYVALAAGEPEAIAAFLGLDVYAFTERYTALTFNRKDLSLTEAEDGRCIFLQDDNTCRIQPVKPAQCKGFPFLWRSKRLEKECAALAGGGDAAPPKSGTAAGGGDAAPPCVPATGASCLLEGRRPRRPPCTPSPALPVRHSPAHPPPLTLGNRSVLVFLTVCTKERRRLLASPDVVRILLDAWRAADTWAVGRYVVMPDHVHLFCAPVNPAFALGQWIAYWKQAFTREWHKRGLGEGEVWQRDHWDTQLRQGDSYHAKWAYVCENPVRAGLAVRAEEWPCQGEMQTLLWHEPR